MNVLSYTNTPGSLSTGSDHSIISSNLDVSLVIRNNFSSRSLSKLTSERSLKILHNKTLVSHWDHFSLHIIDSLKASNIESTLTQDLTLQTQCDAVWQSIDTIISEAIRTCLPIKLRPPKAYANLSISKSTNRASIHTAKLVLLLLRYSRQSVQNNLQPTNSNLVTEWRNKCHKYNKDYFSKEWANISVSTDQSHLINMTNIFS